MKRQRKLVRKTNSFSHTPHQSLLQSSNTRIIFFSVSPSLFLSISFLAQLSIASSSMAISMLSYTISSLSEHSCNFICSSSITSSSLSKCSSSSLSSLQVQFPWHLCSQLRIRNLRSRDVQGSRILPLVKAKKQTFSSLDELITKSDKPVLVDFYATWCGPCQFMVPILEQVLETLKDKIEVAKIDTEKYPKIAAKYKVEALPTFILFKDGEPCDRFEGALPADKLIHRIEASLVVKS